MPGLIQKSRRTRRHRVVSLPTGPGDERGSEVLIHADAETCLRFYTRLFEDGPVEHEGRALAVIDGFDRPIYAAS